MTQAEVKEFLKKIKAHYQEFKMDESYIIKEWIENLIPYDKEDIYEKFKEHLENEAVQKEVPKIQVLTKWLVPTNEKKKAKKPFTGAFYCRWCGEKCSNTYILSLHEERCLRLRFIAKMCNKLQINPHEIFNNDFYRLTLIELDEKYDTFILKVIDEENTKHKLSAQEKEAIRAYYYNVLEKKEGNL